MLEPLLGKRSVLLLEGREHLQRRNLMLPPFHGERMRAYESLIVELAERRVAARAAKDFAESDRLRDEIAAAGWVVRDVADGYELVPR